jgi:hypothetical protein
LPLNGRDWSSLTAFVPGAVDTGGSNQRTIRFAGRGLDDSNWTYDGIDATSIVNQTQRPWVRLAIPLDAIQEFRVDTLMASAEEGGTERPATRRQPRLRAQTASTGACSSSCATISFDAPAA